MKRRSQVKQEKAGRETSTQGMKETSEEDEEINKTDEEIEEEEEFEAVEMHPSDDGSDSAPEDISFSQSKEEAVKSLSHALKQMQEKRRHTKEKRRKHNDLLNEQKKQKLQKLQEKKLSADFLKQVSETSFQKSTAEENLDKPKDEDKDENHKHFDGGNDDDNDNLKQGEDPAPIADRFYVVATQKAEKKPHPISANALSFLHETSYGKHINRKPVMDILATQAKVNRRPADNFKSSKEKKKRRGYKRRPLPIS